MKHAWTTLLVVTGTLATSPAAVPTASTANSAPAAAQSCASLTALKLPNTEIRVAQSVTAGAFSLPKSFPGTFPAAGPRGGLPVVAIAELPEFCRVGGVIKPSNDSEIMFEVWMPASGWNGKFLAVGNGGFAGYVNYPLMTEPLLRHYATASTDTGHEGASPSFALGHKEKLIDHAYRAVHEMTITSKLIINAYYDQAARFSYWNGCSGGGRRGLVEAQKFPSDFDGIVAGDPSNFMAHLTASAMLKGRAIEKDPAALVSPAKLATLHAAVQEACDALDGVKDGILEDPTRCTFDPGKLECNGGDGPDCLTHAQVELVRAFYAPIVNPRTKEQIFPGYMRGSELLWGSAAGNGHMVVHAPYSSGEFLQYAVFQDANWDFRTFDFDRDLARADRLDGGLMNNIDPNLRDFFGRGGKLLQYHGWGDPGISPLSSIDYYSSVAKLMGGPGAVQNSYRLFMVPSMGHCWYGDGPTSFDPINAIDQWVEKGTAPDRIIASRWVDGKIDRTRPLCPYPQVAEYKGTGSTDDANNFVCKIR